MLAITSSRDMPSSVCSYSYTASPDHSSISRCGMQTSAPGNRQRPLKSCLRNVDHSEEMAPNCPVNDTPDGDCHFDCEDCELEKEGTWPAAKEAAKCYRPVVKKKVKIGVVEPRCTVKRKVCFADSKGLHLTTVRVADGPSDTAPKLLDDNLFGEVIPDEQVKLNPSYTYVPDFEQPSSDYLDFRNRLEKDHVCLENLLINDNLTAMGTVKVRNIAFEKSVKVRFTIDEWKTFRDTPAAYVHPEGTSPGDEATALRPPEKYNTFKFQFEIQPNLGGKATSFCVCYQCNKSTFWDNNKGSNYRIISLLSKEQTEHERMLEHYRNLSSRYPWTKVHFHSVDADKEGPYW